MCPFWLCLLMSAVKEAVPEHSSGGRVTWAGERYRWFDCRMPGGRRTNNGKCTEPLCEKHTNAHTQNILPFDLSVSQKSLLKLVFLRSSVSACHKSSLYRLRFDFVQHHYLHVVFKKATNFFLATQQVGFLFQFEVWKLIHTYIHILDPL